MSDPATSAVDARIHAAWTALGARAWAEALAALDGLTAPGRPGAEGRIHAFRAQALEGLGRLTDAEREAMAALRLAKRSGDDAGVAALRALHQRIMAGVATLAAAEKARADDRPLANRPLPELEAEGGPAAAALLVRRANALVDAGRREEALHTLARARELARAAADPREEVFAWLCEARVTPDDAARILAAAHAVADRADDHNLIAAVARAAHAAGVRLAAPEW